MVHVSSKVATLIISLAVAVSDAYELLPDEGSYDYGCSVDISGDTVVVGSTTTEGGGAAFIFSALDGTKLHKLVPEDGTSCEYNFGVDVAISGDTVVVGANGQDIDIDGSAGDNYGSAYILSALDGTELHKLVPDDHAPGDSFGRSVAISGDTVVVGASDYQGRSFNEGFGSAYIFSASTGTQLHKLVPEDGASCDWFGTVSAIDGDTVVIGANQDADSGPGFWDEDSGPDCVDRMGSAYIFSASTGTQLHKLVPEDGAPGDQFGYSVAISGNIVVVGTYSESAYIFSALDGTQLHKLVPEDGAPYDTFGSFGRSVAISGNTVVVGAKWDDINGSGNGSVYKFSASNGTQLAKVVHNNDDDIRYAMFGSSVAISNSNTVVGSDGDTNSAYVFSDWLDSSDVRIAPSEPVAVETKTTTSPTCDDCKDGEFCNYDGPSGFGSPCELCSDVEANSPRGCDTMNLPDKGAEDCKQRCFASSSSSKSIAFLMSSAAVLGWSIIL